MIAVIYGDEPYKVDVMKRKYLNGIGDVLRFEGDFNEEIASACSTFSLFSEKRAVVLTIDTLKALDNKSFLTYLKSPCDETSLVIICRKVDTRLKIYKHLKEANVLVPCMKVKEMDVFLKVIKAELNKLGAEITDDALREFVERINYFELDDMNLLIALSYLRGCAACNKAITIETVKDCVPKHDLSDVFAIPALVEKKDMDGLLREVNLLKENDAIGALSFLLRELRLAYKLNFFNATEVGATNKAFKGISRGKLAKGIKVVTENIEAIKTGHFTSDAALKLTLAEVTKML